MPDDPLRIEISRLRDIGWTLWDPIGLREAEWAEDEYDAYLKAVAAALREGASRDRATDYLVRIECEHMGLGPRPDARERAARTVEAVLAYLAALEMK